MSRCYRSFQIAAIVIVLLAAASALAEPVRVHNTEPKLPPRTVSLEEVWRVGSDDSEFLFGMIIDSVADKKGNVYLLDNQLCMVEVFSPEGTHLKTLSRQGEGPGEVLRPISLTWMGDGTLGVAEMFPGKIVKMTTDNIPAGTVNFLSETGEAGGFIISINCTNRGGVLMLSGMRASMSDDGQLRHHYVARYTESGAEMVRYCQTDALLNFNPPTFVEDELLPPFWFGNAVGPDGRVYVASSRDSYTIDVYAPDGTLERVIEREFKNPKRDDRDFERMDAMVTAWYTGVPVEVQKTFADHEPTITELVVRKDNSLWVLHNRSVLDQPDGVLMTYDTFDAEGNYLQQVHVACDGDPAYDGLRFLGGDRVLLIKGYVLARWASLSPGARVDFGDDQAGEMEVVYCRLVE